MGKIFNLILLLISSRLFSLEPIHSEVVALGHGSATTVKGIGALGFNPAGLGDMENTTFLINSNKIFSYNYLALGSDFPPYGAMGISLSSLNIEDGLGFGWGRRILSGLAGGFGLRFSHAESVWNFNGRLGVIYAHSYRITIGGWLQRTTEGLTTSPKSKESFALGGKYRLTLSTTLYGGISLINRKLDFSAGVEHLIHKHYKLMVSGGLNSVYVGLAANFPNDRFGFTYGYDFNQEQSQNLFTYTRCFESPSKPTGVYTSKEAKSSKDRKVSYSQEKRPKLTQEIKEEQERYLNLGVEHYIKEEYQQALDKWQKVVDLYPDNDLAINAREYIRGVEKMLKRLEEIKKEE